jgi:hypothetical protein
MIHQTILKMIRPPIIMTPITGHLDVVSEQSLKLRRDIYALAPHHVHTIIPAGKSTCESLRFGRNFVSCLGGISDHISSYKIGGNSSNELVLDYFPGAASKAPRHSLVDGGHYGEYVAGFDRFR